MPGRLFVVATPIGNLEDITARALRVLREATLIAAEDTRRTAHLLARYAIGTRTTSLHEHNEAKKTPLLVERLRAGDDIALVSDAGTPVLSDPGQRLISAAVDAGVEVVPIPGPSAAMAALSASGFPTDRVTIMGFPPTRSKDLGDWIEELRSATGTIVFFEAPHRILTTLERIKRAVGDRSVVVCREMTKAHEELVRGPISAVLSRLDPPRGEFTVVIDIGHKTEINEPSETPDADLLTEFYLMTKTAHHTRRRALALLARRHNRSANDIYAAIERAKKIGHST